LGWNAVLAALDFFQ
jgi:hypothetical protein